MRKKNALTLWMIALLVMGSILPFTMKGSTANADETVYDIILKNGTIMDGTGSPSYQADVGLKNGYIYKIGDLSKEHGAEEVDVKGLVVAPGFIDVHSHADEEFLPFAKSSLTQGVTTEILNPDGFGSADITEKFELEEKGLAINVGAYLGFNAVWEEVVGESDRRPTEAEYKEMQALIEKGLADGAWGISSGLTYTPGAFAQTEEIIEVVKAAEKWRTNFPSHIRNENNLVVEATAEIIEIGEKAGLVPVITHMKVMGPDNWGRSAETIGLIDAAIERGTYTAADVYPYLASQTGINAIVPNWAEDGGRQAMLDRFKDPELRAQITDEIEELILDRGESAADVYFPEKRQNLQQFADSQGVRPGEAVIRILETEGDIRTIYYFGKEEDFKRILQHPNVAVASDGGVSESASIHPRRYGTQPRVLGKYVREEGYITLEEAVYKMTGLPATMIGMTDRGLLKEGMVADITVFDPNTVSDLATFDVPKQYSQGMKYVYVNGQLALEDGEVTGVHAGKFLKRTANMPSRPESFSKDTKLEVKGKLLAIDGPRNGKKPSIELSINQEAYGDATGTFSFEDPANGIKIENVQLGQVQTLNDDWASLTGVGVVDDSDEVKAFSVIIDKDDPMVAGMKATVTIQIEGGYEVKGVLVPGKVGIEISDNK
ncbi:dihydroorotase/N-acyl-D-amino-acid deacylase [Bacillus oleivorans]|uniref:Dihydroorotase/N-acyl-D-amino-acid deacylase n=1 Tax=Bacillus oleivorans TaxID=1448271 RepID=A0A285D6X5_9BACI|nr:D-aminoacylase [Bacillus oleivorans]SNX75552.1 dihydroorotase/N-acyl-D-amino-acid deacylase [Bacillus oleivorans]